MHDVSLDKERDYFYECNTQYPLQEVLQLNKG